MSAYQHTFSSKLTEIEKELNSYPIKGFRFRVERLESNMSLFDLNQIRLDISAEYEFPNPASPEYVLMWFYLILDGYVDKNPANKLDIRFEHDRTAKTYAYLTVVC